MIAGISVFSVSDGMLRVMEQTAGRQQVDCSRDAGTDTDFQTDDVYWCLLCLRCTRIHYVATNTEFCAHFFPLETSASELTL